MASVIASAQAKKQQQQQQAKGAPEEPPNGSNAASGFSFYSKRIDSSLTPSQRLLQSKRVQTEQQQAPAPPTPTPMSSNGTAPDSVLLELYETSNPLPPPPQSTTASEPKAPIGPPARQPVAKLPLQGLREPTMIAAKDTLAPAAPTQRTMAINEEELVQYDALETMRQEEERRILHVQELRRQREAERQMFPEGTALRYLKRTFADFREPAELSPFLNGTRDIVETVKRAQTQAHQRTVDVWDPYEPNRNRKPGSVIQHRGPEDAIDFRALNKTDKDQLVRQGFADLLKEWETVHICVRCSQAFCELENMGVWVCTYHPGMLRVRYGEMRWSCCGEASHSGRNKIFQGCTRCDHSMHHYPEGPPSVTRIPILVIPYLKHPPYETSICARFIAGEGRELESTVDIIRNGRCPYSVSQPSIGSVEAQQRPVQYNLFANDELTMRALQDGYRSMAVAVASSAMVSIMSVKINH